jgi:hypothetical protein
MTRVTQPQSARQQRHLAYISEFTTDLRHTPGSENVVADALSRPPAVMVVVSRELKNSRTATQGLPVLSIPLLSSPSEPQRLTALPVPAADAQPIDFLELSFAQLPNAGFSFVVQCVSKVWGRRCVRRRLHRNFQTTAARPVQVRRRAVPPQHSPSRHRSNQKNGVRKFLLAKNWFVRVCFDPQLPTLSEREGTPPCVASGCAHSSSSSPLLPHSRRSCWSTASLFRFFVPVHCY